MKRFIPALALTVLILAAFVAPAGAAPHCATGQEPEFLFGFAHLKSLLGETMGLPTECENSNPQNGDTLQNTTAGLAFNRKSTNIPTFTDGFNHWGWTADGLVHWTGDAIDAPGYAPPPTPTPAATVTPVSSPTPQATPAATATPTVAAFVPPDVKAMDERSGGPGVDIRTAVEAFVENVAATWGWRPTQLVTFYLHGSRSGFSAGLESVFGERIDREFYETNITAVAIKDDVVTGGRAVVMNLELSDGTLMDLELTTVILAHEYTHVLQFDFVSELQPVWFVEGMANTVAFSNYPLGVGRYRYNTTVPAALRGGFLPSISELDGSWTSFQSSLERLNLAYGAAYYAVNHAAERA